MSEGTPPTDPDQPPSPTDPTVAWTPPAPAEPPAPPTTPGLISSAPVGWTGQDIGGPPQTPNAAGPWMPNAGGTGIPPAPPAAASNWAPPTRGGLAVPGAPGLVFAETAPRFVAWVIDGFLLAVVGSVIGAVFGLGTTTVTRSATSFSAYTNVTSAAFAISFAILSLLYFVFFWTGGRRSTIGQRIFSIQVGNAFDGRGLTVDQAVRRWIGLGSFLGLLALLPSVRSGASGIQLLWVLVLLFTTVTSPTKQGLHDRFANSAVVRPAGSGGSGVAMACLIIVVIVALIALAAVVAFIFLGSQVSDILEDVARSV